MCHAAPAAVEPFVAALERHAADEDRLFYPVLAKLQLQPSLRGRLTSFFERHKETRPSV